MWRPPFFAILCILAPLLAGCAHDEFAVVEPKNLAQVVKTDHVSVIMIAPIEYRMTAYEGRLVVEAHNRAKETVQFLGERSSVVDPVGQSHPLRSQSIPAGAFMKLVLPPLTHFGPAPPQVGLGFGVGYGGGYRDGLGLGETFREEPRYVVVDGPAESGWDWKADSDIRLELTYQLGADKPITHDWTIHRQRSSTRR